MGANFNMVAHKKHQQHQQQQNQIPKGYLAIKVGQKVEEQQRFVVPVVYFNHPLFMRLLKEAEDEYGFEQKGTITIPCHVEEFRHVRGLIEHDMSFNGHQQHHRRGNGHHHHHHGHHNIIVGCFRA